MNRHILIVDDNPSDLLLSSFHVEKLGFEPVKAVDGFSAIEQLNAFDYQVIIVDLQMPIMSGIELIKRIRRIEKFKSIPIMVTSARQQSRDVMLAVNVGANDYIVKPIDDQIFEEKLFKLVGKNDDWAEYPIPQESQRAGGFYKKQIDIQSISEVGATVVTDHAWNEGETQQMGINLLQDQGIPDLMTRVVSSKSINGKFISKVSFVGLTEEIRMKIRLICQVLWKQHRKT